jgi:hypothetical protein
MFGTLSGPPEEPEPEGVPQIVAPSIHQKRLRTLLSSFCGVRCGSSSSSVEPVAGAIAGVVPNRPLVLAHHKSINHPAKKTNGLGK